MLILPAIDIRNGKCVRLQQGDYNQETIYADSPVDMAKHWVQHGAEFLHIVDLDGAKDKKPTNLAVIREIAQSIAIPIEVGGGIRNQETIQNYLDAGVHRLVIGTLAHKEPDWFREMSQRFPQKLVLGIDGRDGFVATEGWLETSQTPATDLAKRYAELPLSALVYTDIAKDGMLEGPNIEEMEAMRRAVPFPLVVSGGISSLEDVQQLARRGFSACIIGKALYENRFPLPDAIAAGMTVSPG
ncbi:MAG: 1-(5-phosphoribosyl)-5-[(5-phosphoribosylamino)methylideneamino]imidazole-4-carboxamide isomerase [Planctomycetaceae bacterium]|nr:1-(5-phosphoribosyl)-5-[(5-phosphoribosylamino)methylideneamino]imidazole-4-carboxamide isomerase [Planctomycetaceae bacterium]